MNERIVPVVVIDDADHARPLAEALRAGGIRCAEITLRTEAALDAIAAIAPLDDFTVGVGTVTSVRQLELAVDAGARFAVSPGLDEALVARATDLDVPMVPGVATATEALRAVRLQVKRVKLFPADRLGGLGTIRALSAVFPTLRFMPSGGVDESNAADYLADPSVWAVSGSWMAPRPLIHAGDFAQITRLSRAATALAAERTP